MNRQRLSNAISGLHDLISKLRGPGGCPWDAQQTDATLKIYLLEEAYEVLDALENGNYEDVCHELGDLLFQIVFLVRLAEEKGQFDLVEVIEKIMEKMIKRHPHVFGDVEVKGPEDVAVNWEKIKQSERRTPKPPSSLLRSIPVDLPALLKAHRLHERASGRDSSDRGKQAAWVQVETNLEELREAILEENTGMIEEVMGDYLFGLVNLTRQWGLNAEMLLRKANQKFINRFQKMEDDLIRQGVNLDRAGFGEMRRALKTAKDKSEVTSQ